MIDTLIKGTVTARTVRRAIGFRTRNAADICIGRVRRAAPERFAYAYIAGTVGNGAAVEVILFSFIEQAAIVDFERWTLRMANIDTDQQGDDRTSVAYVLPAEYA